MGWKRWRDNGSGARPGASAAHLRALAAAVVAAMAAPWPAPALADELLVVGTRFENVYERNKHGEFSGMGAEIIRKVARQLGHTVKFGLYPWPRAQAMMKQHEADILVGPYKTAQRLAYMAYAQRPFFQDQVVFYTLSGAGIDWHGDHLALRGRPIVILNGWAYGDEFDLARPALQVSVANSVENGLNMLLHRHVDMFASNRRDTEPVVERLRMRGKVVALTPYIKVENAYFAFPKRPGHDKLRLQFDQALNALIDSGELKKMARRYSVDVP
ncbi:polar amino acid transport system substrate-binding protein [Janthinobacterium sp. CG_23.3]|uniref:substrate-binding periplasmic protein n=1 Tax=Janthinobacterium sp. CG_23.3 TaxID=3349634 RepID=UPI0038D45544